MSAGQHGEYTVLPDAKRQPGPLLVALFSMFMMGGIWSITGALLPTIVEDLALSDARAGVLVSSLAVGYTAVTALAGTLTDRLGFRRIWLFALGLGLAALLIIFALPGFGSLLAGVVGLGMVSGALDGCINPLVASIAPERSGNLLNRVHLFFGLGATVTPLLVSLGTRLGLPWQGHYLLQSVYVLAMIGIVVRTRFPEVEAEAGGAIGPFRNALASRGVLVAMLTILIYGGVESSVFSWIALYLKRVRSVPAEQASLGVSLFAGMLMLGRLLCGWITERVGYKRLVVGSSLLGGLALAIVTWGPAKGLAWLAVGLVGLFYAGIFATLMADATRRVETYKGTVAGLLCTSAGVGNMGLPWIVGLVAGWAGLTAGITIVFGASLLMGFLYLLS